MKKFVSIFVALSFIAGSFFTARAAANLYEYYNGELPTIEERGLIYQGYGFGSVEDYTGRLDQNIKLLDALQSEEFAGPTLGASLDLSSPVAFYEDSLASSINSAATSFTLVRGTDKVGTALASSTYAFVIDEGTSNEEMVIADCTGTACSNVTRGISILTGTSTVSALQKPHRRGASVKITDGPVLLQLFHLANGAQNFPNALVYKTNTTCSKDYHICPKTYIDNSANQGAATSTESNGGIVELATRTEAASTTASTADKPLVLQAQHATSTPGSDITAAGGSGETYIVMTEDDGKISQSFLDLTENYTVTGEWVLNGATTTTHNSASSTITDLTNTNGYTTTATIQDLTIQNSCTNCAATTTFIAAPEFNTEFSTAWLHSTTTPTNDIFPAIVTNPAAGDGDARATTVVPKGVTGISAIKVIFQRTTTGNLRLQFDTGHIKLQAGALPYTQQADATHAIASFNVATGDDAVDAITVPSDAYDGLSGITEGDIVSINLFRGYTSNTYQAEMRVYGILFEWQ